MGCGLLLSLGKRTKPLWPNYKVKYKKEAYVFLRSFCTSSYRPQVYTWNPNFNMRHKCLSALSKGLSPSVHLVQVSVATFVLTLYFLYFCCHRIPELQDCSFAQAYVIGFVSSRFLWLSSNLSCHPSFHPSHDSLCSGSAEEDMAGDAAAPTTSTTPTLRAGHPTKPPDCGGALCVIFIPAIAIERQNLHTCTITTHAPRA